MLAACNNQPKNIFLQEWDTPYGTAPFSKIAVSDYMPAFQAGLEEQKANVQKIIDNSAAPTFENTIQALEQASPSKNSIKCVTSSAMRSNCPIN